MAERRWRQWALGQILVKGVEGHGIVFGIPCTCGAFVALVAEDGEDVCPGCGMRYRLVIEYATRGQVHPPGVRHISELS